MFLVWCVKWLAQEWNAHADSLFRSAMPACVLAPTHKRLSRSPFFQITLRFFFLFAPLPSFLLRCRFSSHTRISSFCLAAFFAPFFRLPPPSLAFFLHSHSCCIDSSSRAEKERAGEKERKNGKEILDECIEQGMRRKGWRMRRWKGRGWYDIGRATCLLAHSLREWYIV